LEWVAIEKIEVRKKVGKMHRINKEKKDAKANK
jgi:hypothetical protein